jgi:integration host factor subunit alpha
MARRKGGTTKADLIDQVYRNHGGLTKNEAASVVESIFATVKTTLVEGRSVRIKNFGTFEVTERPGRRGVNPSSGKEIFIHPHKGLSFRPARMLKDVVAPVAKPPKR